MKPLVLFSLLAISFVASQDVDIPTDLLNTTEVTGGNSEEHTSPPDFVIDPRDHNFGRPTFPGSPPCDVVPPIPDDGWRDEPDIIEPPIIEEREGPFEPDIHRQCPIGTFLNGTACVNKKSENCPQDYVWRNNHCVLSRTICPENFELDGRSCVPRRVCPNNYFWEDGRCVQTTSTPVCQFGWRWNGNVCEIGEIRCQKGYVLNANRNSCVYERTTCPRGFTEGRNGCVKQDPVCQPEYSFSASSGFCEKISHRCGEGFFLENGRCISVDIRCPVGSRRVGDTCIRPQPPKKDPTTTVKPKIKYHCPEGYTYHDRMCYRCSDSNRTLCNWQCIPRTRPCHNPSPYPCHPHNPSYPCTQYPNNPSQPTININIHTNDHGSPRSSSSNGYNIVNNIEPINNTIVNFNNVSHPVTLNNVNQNNIYIYSNIQCPDGSIGTSIVKNNETTNGCVDVKSSTTEGSIPKNSTTVPEKCCEIVTPRQCKQRNEGQWACTHRRHKFCGSFCFAERLYLKPRETTYNNKVLTIAPTNSKAPVSPCFGRRCPQYGKQIQKSKLKYFATIGTQNHLSISDCSGCTDGSFNCSAQCYTYPCNHDECSYLDQEDFCGNVGGQICE